MLKEIIVSYVESIDALRDFVDSIKLLLEEHEARLIDAEDPGFRERRDQAKNIMRNLPRGESEVQISVEDVDSGEIVQKLSLKLPFNIEEMEESEKEVFFATLWPAEPIMDASMETQRRVELLYRSSLITLTSTVELFLSDLLQVYFSCFPDAVGAHEKS